MSRLLRIIPSRSSVVFPKRFTSSIITPTSTPRTLFRISNVISNTAASLDRGLFRSGIPLMTCGRTFATQPKTLMAPSEILDKMIKLSDAAETAGKETMDLTREMEDFLNSLSGEERDSYFQYLRQAFQENADKIIREKDGDSDIDLSASESEYENSLTKEEKEMRELRKWGIQRRAVFQKVMDNLDSLLCSSPLNMDDTRL